MLSEKKSISECWYYLLKVGAGVRLGRQLEELLLVHLVDLHQAAVFLHDDVFECLDLKCFNKQNKNSVCPWDTKDGPHGFCHKSVYSRRITDVVTRMSHNGPNELRV